MMHITNSNYLESDPFVKDNDNFAVNCSECLRKKERKKAPESSQTISTWG